MSKKSNIFNASASIKGNKQEKMFNASVNPLLSVRKVMVSCKAVNTRTFFILHKIEKSNKGNNHKYIKMHVMYFIFRKCFYRLKFIFSLEAKYNFTQLHNCCFLLLLKTHTKLYESSYFKNTLIYHFLKC